VLRIGLTGGLASGKSFVGRALADLGCLLVKADELGHLVLEPDGEAFEAVVKEFGRGILGENGAIDRKRLAAEVFNRPDRLAALNAIVHPPVIRLEEKIIEEFASRKPDGIAVMEAAILIETGSYKRFDKLIVAVCTPEQQVQRASERDGLTREEALARIARQMPLAEKLKYADYVVDTSGAKEDTLRQVKEVWNQLRSLAK
jgi:dephospho-CoA kinase